MNKKINDLDWELLHDVIAKRNPKLVLLLHSLQDTVLREDQRDALLDAISDELCETGIGNNGEPNILGKRLDDLISFINNIGRSDW